MDSSEIDFSKENIQPLKEGRLTSYLGTALNAQCNIKSQNELLKEREKFELELRKYKGDDPLEIWYNYICWVIQSYPNSGIGHLAPLLHKCLAIFKDDERYLQDIRYVKLWIKYIQMQNDPVETYEMAHKHGIGSKCAEFYKSWAEEYEKVGDFKSASSIFTKGSDFAAQPASDLALYQRSFEDRVARHMVQKMENGWEDSNGEERRQVLSSLAHTSQGRGRHQANVGSLRIGAAVAGPPGPLKLSSSSRQEQKPSHFQIFSDHRGAESRNCVRMETLPSASVTNRENMMKPGKWTNPNSSKRPNVPEAPHIAPFKVHEDLSSGQGVATPHGASFSENVLKPRKAVKDDFDCPLVIFEPPDPTKISMYCKDKVYSGGVEFSLEEIRAIRYFEAENKKQHDLAILKELSKPLAVECENKESCQHPRMESNQLHAVWPSNEDLLDTHVFTTPKNVQSEENQLEDERHGANRLNGGPLQHLDFSSVPSPTINTRAANAMMNELWSTTFTQSLADLPHVVPLQPQSNIPKFEIPFDETTGFQELPDPEEKAIRIQTLPKVPKFQIHFDENSVFQDMPCLGEKEIKSTCSEKIPSDRGSHIPFVPPPKEDAEENVDEDDSKENCRPLDCPTTQQTERRALAGILEPSKNIPFQALEDDDSSKDQEDSNEPQNEEMDERHHGIAPARHNPFNNGIGNTSFEREILRSLKDDTVLFDASKKRRITVSEDQETNIFSQIGNGGITFKQTHTHMTVEAEISPNLGTISNWVSQDHTKESTNRVTLNNNGILSASECDEVWEKVPKMLTSHGSSEPGISDRVETVENPCDYSMLERLLAKLPTPVSRSKNFYRILQKIPFLKTNDELNLRRGLKLKIQKVINNSVDAKFYLAVKEDGEYVVMKCQKVSCEWEFHVISEIRSRLRDSHVNAAFANIMEGYLFNLDASILLMEYLHNGTLLNLLNLYKIKQQMFPEVLVLYFTIDIINTVRNMHGCNIIHGSVNPENLLVRAIPRIPDKLNEEYFCNYTPVLQLINFGKSIDMTLFSKNVHFTSTSTDSKYQCIEMQTGRPWTFQADFYNIAFTIHCMIFGEFMDVSCANGIWAIKRKIPVQFNVRLWNNLFNCLINVPSCENLPDLLSMQRNLQEYMLTYKLDELKSALSTMKLILEEESSKRK